MKKTSCLFLLLFLTLPLFAQVPTNLYRQVNQEQLKQWVDSIYATLSLDEKVGQLFMPIAESNSSWRNKIGSFVNEQKIGGILFSKGNLQQQAEATNYAQSISRIPLLIALDGEWGLSMRLTDASKFPRNMTLGAIQNDSLLYIYGKEVARQCREMGIHINFAPTLDVNSNPNNPVIGTRSFGENSKNVADKGIAYSRGLEDGGIMSVAKHFPGHGDTADDSHHTLPTIPHSTNRLDSMELYPFGKYIEAGLSGMMIGHLNVPALKTDGLPASLSANVTDKLLKQSFGFTGLVFTDGMAMKGVSTQPDASVKALLAGNDIVLGVINQSKEFESVKKAVQNGTISNELLTEKVKKILAYKYILQVNNKPIEFKGLNERINTPYAQWLNRKLYSEALTLLKNESDLLPVKRLESTRIAAVAIGTQQEPVFQKWMKRYSGVKTFQVQQSAKLVEIEKELENYDLVIYSIHENRFSSSANVNRIVKKQNSVVVFFASSYDLKNNALLSESANAVVMAYDNTDEAQSAAAQALFGGTAISGKLPVSADFAEGSGLQTIPTRLSYQLPEEKGIASAALSGIDKIAMEGIRQRAYPGCYVLVVKDGTVIYDKAFGSFDYDRTSKKVDENTVYDLASVTKATATLPAVMKLYDEKKIKLQDALSKFVPQLKGSDKMHITVREALLHESGITPFIPYYMSAIDENSYSGQIFTNRKSEIHNAFYAGSWGRTDYKFKSGLIAQTPDAKHKRPVAEGMYVGEQMHDVLLKDIIDSKLRRHGHYAYSCLNFMLLKEMIENISKQDLNTFVQDNFYRKLGMATTTFLPIESISVENIPPTENDPFFRKQQLRGYVHDEGAALFGGISGNAGLFSNANDLAKLCQMFLNGGEYGGERLLSESTVKLFTTAKSSVSRRGLGFDKPDPSSSKSSPCSPQTPVEVYGHTGYTGTSFWIDPTNNLIYIFLSNRVYPDRSPNKLSSLSIRERIQEEIYNALQP